MHSPAQLAVALVLMSIWAGANALELVTEDDPPHNMLRNGKVVGISTEKLEEAFRRAGIPQQISLMPWARAYRSALTQADYCVFSAARTVERESLFKWIGPVGATEWVLYTRAGWEKPARLENVRDKIIGGYVQDVISVWLADHGYQVEPATSDAINPRKLLAGRIDYWASTRPRATALLMTEGLVGKVVPALTFGRTDLYLACHQSTPDTLVHQVNTALRQMQQDGTSAKIDARYARWPKD